MPSYKKASLFVTLLFLLSNGIVAERDVTCVSVEAINKVASLSVTDPKLLEVELINDPKDIYYNNKELILDAANSIKEKLDEISSLLIKCNTSIIRKTYTTDVTTVDLVINMYDDLYNVLGIEIPSTQIQIERVLEKHRDVTTIDTLDSKDLKLVKEAITTLYGSLNEKIEDMKATKAAEAAESKRLAEARSKLEKDLAAEAAKAEAAKAEAAKAEAAKEAAAKEAADNDTLMNQLINVADAVKEALSDPKVLMVSGVGLFATLLLILYYIKCGRQLTKTMKECDKISFTTVRNRIIAKYNRMGKWVLEAKQANASLKKPELDEIATTKEEEYQKEKEREWQRLKSERKINESKNTADLIAFTDKKPLKRPIIEEKSKTVEDDDTYNPDYHRVYGSPKEQQRRLSDFTSEYGITELLSENEVKKILEEKIKTSVDKSEQERIIYDIQLMTIDQKRDYIKNGYKKVSTSTCSIQ